MNPEVIGVLIGVASMILAGAVFYTVERLRDAR